VGRNIVETIVGALVLVVAGVFVFYAFAKSDRTGSDGYELVARFGRIDGLKRGADVTLSGVKVGTVVSQELNYGNYQASITMTIDSRLELTDDATAKVTAEGLLGSRFITLEQGGSDTKLADGGVISNTQGAVDIWSLISQAMFEKETGGGTANP